MLFSRQERQVEQSKNPSREVHQDVSSHTHLSDTQGSINSFAEINLWVSPFHRQKVLRERREKEFLLKEKKLPLNPFNSKFPREQNPWYDTECYQEQIKRIRREAAKLSSHEETTNSVDRIQTGQRSPTGPRIPNPDLCDQFIGPELPFTLNDLHPTKEHENVEFIRKDGKLAIKFLTPVRIDQCVEKKCVKIKPNGILRLYSESPLLARVTIYNLVNFDESYLRGLCLQEGVEFVSYSSCGQFGEFQYIASSVGSCSTKDSTKSLPDDSDEDLSFSPRLPVINSKHIQDLVSTDTKSWGSEQENIDGAHIVFDDRAQYANSRRDSLLGKYPRLGKLIEGMRFPMAQEHHSSSKYAPLPSLCCVIPGESKKAFRIVSDYTSCHYAALIEALLRRVQQIKRAHGEVFSLKCNVLPWRVVDGESERGLSEFCESIIKIFSGQEYGKYLLCPTGLQQSIEAADLQESKLASLLKESIGLHANLPKDHISHKVSISPQKEDSVPAIISLLAILLSNSVGDINEQISAWITDYSEKGPTLVNEEDSNNLGLEWTVQLSRVLSHHEGLNFVQCFRLMQHTVGRDTGQSKSAKWVSISLSYALLDWYCNENEQYLISYLLQRHSDWTLPFITAVLLDENIEMKLLNEVGLQFFTQLSREGLYGCAAIVCFFLPDVVLREKLLLQLSTEQRLG